MIVTTCGAAGGLAFGGGAGFFGDGAGVCATVWQTSALTNKITDRTFFTVIACCFETKNKLKLEL